MNTEARLLAVTPGEPAGIGPEIVLKLVARHPEFNLVAVADPDLLRQAADALDLEISIREWQPGEAIPAGALPCKPVRLARPAVAGRPDPDNAAYVIDTLRQAQALVRDGHASALVTGPVNKAVINDAAIPFSGHTEFLAELSQTPSVVMMLAAPGLRVALVTTHLPLRSVAQSVTAKKLGKVIRITHDELIERFGIANPRLQVLGLNPHAGEGGHLGQEDDAVIRPVIRQYRDQGMDLLGPVPADTAFTPPRLAACDAVVAMYHDQGLPVLKHMGFGQSVNITLGLPYVRTSVDHGTALDIAGSGLADSGSLYHAMRMARQLSGS
jgi:4-hydroxythreonine-4-phosphate dehydrogenase